MKKLLTFILGITSFMLIAQNQLLIPSTLSGDEIDLSLQNGEFEFFAGHKTATMGVNGPLLGPTLILKKGNIVNMNVTNNLNQATTIHWHGLHVSSENDGGPHLIIEPNTTWSPSFEIKNRASTCWYHPHLDTYTDEHVSNGLAGFIIVQDDEEAQFDLPRTYGVDDIPLVVQTKDFDNNFQILHGVNSDDVLMVNGTRDAYVDVPAQVIRLRLLDGTSQRVLNFGLENNQKFFMIATDGGLIEASVELTRLPMSPGERAEILVDFTGMEGQTVNLMSYASELENGIYGAKMPAPSARMVLDGYNPNALNGTDFNIISFKIGDKTSNSIHTIPKVLAGETPPDISKVNENRSLDFHAINPGRNQLNSNFYINDVSFNMDVINMTIDLNNIEIWTITNRTPIAHPFHIHDVGFHILDIDGNPPPIYARGKKDTYLIPGQGSELRFITQFSDFANDSIPYMYHCHMLKHEDGGMMGSFVVIDKTSSINDLDANDEIILYPNPTKSSYVTVETKSKQDKIKAYSIIDMKGQILSYHLIDKNELSHQYSIPLYDYSSGNYILKIYVDDLIYDKKLTILK